jgi:hypothetical protein
MTQLTEFKRAWQELFAESIIDGIGEEEVKALLQNRSAKLKKQILKRLITEIRIYFFIALSLLLISFAGSFGPGNTFFTKGFLALLILVPSISVLAYKEYKLRTLPMTGSLRESVSTLIKAIDSITRLYLFVYFASIVLSLTLIEILLISRKGWTVITILSILVGLAFIGWSYLSGRNYASRMFRRYRSELVLILSELESE